MGRARPGSRARPRPSRAACASSSGSCGRALERLVAERRAVGVVDRRLEGCRAHVTVEHSRVRVVEDRGLDLAVEQRLRARRMKYWSSASSLATSTARPCPRRPARPHCCRSDAIVPGKPTEIAQSSRPMSIPSSSASVALTPSRSPSTRRRSISRRCCGRVAGAVRREPRRGGRVEPVGCEAVDQLGSLAALREADRAQAALRELCEQTRRVAERGSAHAELLVEQLGVPEHDGSLRARRGVVADDGRLHAEQSFARARRGSRSSRRRAGTAAPRRTSRRPAQPAQDVADVRAEHAAVDVRLVDDDVAQVLQDVAPPVVVREHADVEHVGVREDQVRPLADLPAPVAFGVAVVDRRLHARHGELGERAQPGPARAPSSGRGTARGSSAHARARRAPAG